MPCRKNPYFCQNPEVAEWEEEKAASQQSDSVQQPGRSPAGSPDSPRSDFTITLCQPHFCAPKLLTARCLPGLICRPMITPGKEEP